MATIEYVHKTWNPATGCLPGKPCWAHCWARKMAHRIDAMGRPGYEGFAPHFHEERLDELCRRRKPTRYAACFMGDLAHQGEYEVNLIINACADSSRHRFLILTKDPVALARSVLHHHAPPSNVWIGTSVSNQAEADERIPVLLAGFPGWHTWVSIEPCLGPVLLERWLPPFTDCDHYSGGCTRPENVYANTGNPTARPCLLSCGPDKCIFGRRAVEWVVLGGESGPGARPMHPDWARSLRDQCQEAGVPWWFKQWGEFAPIGGREDFFAMERVGKHAAGDLLDGVQYHEFPDELRVEWEKEESCC